MSGSLLERNLEVRIRTTAIIKGSHMILVGQLRVCHTEECALVSEHYRVLHGVLRW